MKRILLFVSLVLLTARGFGQDDPSPPTPTPSLSIEGPVEGKRDNYNDFKATGGPEKGTFQWIVLPLGNALKLREFDGGKSVSIVGPPGAYTLLLAVSDGTAKQLDQHEFVIPGSVDPPKPDPNPPKPKTLAQLAGDKAAPLGQMYAVLLADIGKDIDTIEVFKVAEEHALKSNNLVGHGATAEIAKRTAVKTLDELKPALEKIISELSTPPAPPGPAGFNVLIIEETDDRSKLPPTQLAILQTTQIKQLVTSKGGQFRQYDDDPEISDPVWRELRNRPRTTLPWIIVSTGDNVIEQPLPSSIEATLTLIGSAK